METTPENLIHSGQPSQTALGVATLRAAHQLLDEPVIFDDRLSLSILGAEAEARLRENPFQFNDPFSLGVRASLVARSRLAEDELSRAIQGGVRQYVVLGAGLDTSTLRHADTADGLQMFEVDHPSTQRWKRAMLEAAAIPQPASMRFVGVDFERDALSSRLQNAGFRPDQPAFFAWLGVTVYLLPEAVVDTLKFVGGLPAGSAIVFDYRVQPSMLDPMQRAIGERLARYVSAQGEPWKSSFDPAALQETLRGLGFKSLQDLGPDDLNARYFTERKDGLRVGGGFRLMCAKV
ncbi:class I SAM-dependent methyltransferase [Herbaspirillum sp. ST 5-3]|uniref:class I SAM-dependent methyltransferase n=1 Tax=Oxalobacteraceae TaxID=75682 RepID=UPI0010A30C55|nr:class I SAM-dependent methyltransferase [Herbaspirillum sp. ST 5-3]